MAAQLVVLGLPEDGLDVAVVGLEDGLEVLEGVPVALALPQQGDLHPALQDQALLGLGVDLEQPVDVLLGLVGALHVEKEDAGVVERLVVGPLPLVLELGVEGEDGLPVDGLALLVGVDQGQQGAKLDLGDTQSQA